MNTPFSTSRFALQSMVPYRVMSAAIAVIFVLMVGMMSVNVFAADESGNDDVCATLWTKIALKDDVVSVYSGSVEGGPNGFLVGQFDLKEIPGITDEERASNSVIWLLTQNLESAEGWTVKLYWYQDRYGATASGPVIADVDGVSTYTDFSDDTGARCVL